MSRRLTDRAHPVTADELSNLIWDRFATLREASEVVGFDRTQLCKLMNDRRPITANTSDIICARLDRYDAKAKRRASRRRQRDVREASE